MADFRRGSVWLPNVMHSDTGSITFNNYAIDATSKKVAFVFNCSAADTITYLGFRYGVRTGTPPTYRISLQGVGTDGCPDGTIKGGGTPASATFTPPADTTWDGLWKWITLTNSYTCARGEYLAVVIDYSSGTIDASNNSSFTYSNAIRSRTTFPIGMYYTGSAWTKSVSLPVFGLKSSSNVYGYVFQNIAYTLYSSDSTPDEYAIAFQLDAGYGSTYQVLGVSAFVYTSAAGKTLRVNLYDGTTVLQSIDFDTDFFSTTSSGYRDFSLFFDEATLSNLNFGSTYRLGFQPQDTAHNFALFCYEAASANDLLCFGGGTQIWLSTRTDQGAWTDVTTKRPIAALLLADWTEPAGGGAGGVSRSRVQGGM